MHIPSIIKRFNYLASTLLFVVTSAIMSVGPAVLSSRVFADGTVAWNGTQGISSVTANQCKDDTPAAGDLLWIFTAAGATSATIAINDNSFAMTQQGQGNGSFHYVQHGFGGDFSSLAVSATYVGTLNGNNTPQLTISHGCPAVTAAQVTPTAPLATTPTCDNQNEIVTPPTITGIVWSPVGSTTLEPGHSVTYTASAAQGYVLKAGVQTSFTVTNNFDPTTCVTPPKQVVPIVPTTTVPSCNLMGETVTPTVTMGVVWSPSVSTTLQPGQSVTYTASAAQGYVLKAGVQTSFTVTNNFDVHTCDTPAVTVCHATDSRTNPYVAYLNLPAAGAYNGHMGHTGPVYNLGLPKNTKWGDIIPPFYFNGQQYSLNWDANGQAIYNNGCKVAPKEVTPTAPTFSDSCGMLHDTFTIPTQTGVTYKIGYLPLGHGTYPGVGKITITAVAEDGYTLTGTSTWTFTFNTDACKVTLCHANMWGWDEVTINDDSAFGDWLIANHVNHDSHDIIPSFTYFNGTHYAGKNLLTNFGGTTGQQILDHDCKKPQPQHHYAKPVAPSVTTPSCNLTTVTVTPPTIIGVVWSPVGSTTLQPGQSVTYVATPDAGYMFAGNQQSVSYPFTNNFTVEGCGGGETTPASPATVEFKDATCDTAGTYTVPSTRGVRYEDASGNEVKAGTYSAVPGQVVTINAFAESGYTLTSTATWSHTFAAATNCGHVLGDTTTPPTTGGKGQVLAAATTLADTGTSTVLPTILAISISLTAAGVMFGSNMLRKRAASNNL